MSDNIIFLIALPLAGSLMNIQLNHLQFIGLQLIQQLLQTLQVAWPAHNPVGRLSTLIVNGRLNASLLWHVLSPQLFCS